MNLSYSKYNLRFKVPGGTSRGVLKQKSTYFLNFTNNSEKYIGECNMFKGLSADDTPDFEKVLKNICSNFNPKKSYTQELKMYPSILFGIEQILLKIKNQENICFDNLFTKSKIGIPINGLIWMGTPSYMKQQINEKIKANYKVLKLKIGNLDFEEEYQLIKSVRKQFPKDLLELRVDANGAFSTTKALRNIERLSKLDIHSIEQPIATKKWKEMQNLCIHSAIDIALDEELIGIHKKREKIELLEYIKPKYIILKPALLGGFTSCSEWIELANDRKIKWWITSALESNIGLEAIAQYTASKNTKNTQGLGTGQLFTNNIPSTLHIKNAELWQ